jgi:hypothetical protein
MHHIDVPTSEDLLALTAEHGSDRVTIYLHTSPLPTEAVPSRRDLKNRAKDVEHRLSSPAGKAVVEKLLALVDDEEFWREQCHSLAIFASETTLRTFRLPQPVPERVAVADRFEVGPLCGTAIFPRSAFVLAVSESTSRLVEVSANGRGRTLEVSGLPVDPIVMQRTDSDDRAPMPRPQGSSGERVEIQKYLRLAHDAIIPTIRPSAQPLILATSRQLAHQFEAVNSYEHLVPEIIEGNFDAASDTDLAGRSEPIIDALNARTIEKWREEYDLRESQGRGALDVSDIARASVMGAVESLMIDMTANVRGTLNEADATVHLSEGEENGDYSLLDELAARVLNGGGRVLAVTNGELPRGSQAAAILRYALT